ncbi:FAD-binding oxidoreductase [Jiangella endophytica]|uniref:FAD-binding oxidoreductase n=1 Tax=Jiangella endophytica TaxID=1623398 RepID=UPI000E34B631|nr:FAD-binding oxidoreductase [Jiangella endophytica]
MSDVSTLVVDGELIRPGDDAYDTHRNTYQRHGSPALIVRARGVDDVRRAIAAAREHDLLLSVRSGGHGFPGFATNDGGIVLDLGPLDGVEVIDPDRRLVRIGAGARWAAVTEALAPHGWAVSSGDTTDVGVGGLILGGGIGWMVRRFGLTIDAVVAAEVVTADGRVLRASAAENADLFWALRGGGGAFAVVTAFEVIAQPVPEVYFGHIAYPRGDAAAVLRGWRDAMRAAPDELTSMVVLLPEGFAPHALVVGVCVAHGDAAAAEDVVEPLLRLGEASVLDLRVRPYGEILAPPPPVPPNGAPPLARNRLTTDLSDELIDAYLAGLAGGPPVVGQVRALGGAVARVRGTETAFAHRDSEAFLSAVALSPAPEARAAFDAYWATLAPHTRGAYGNLMSSLDPADVAELYPPETSRRLAAVKAGYDPDQLFRQAFPVG